MTQPPRPDRPSGRRPAPIAWGVTTRATAPPGRARRVPAGWHVWLPAVLLVLVGIWHVPAHLPGVVDFTGEVYQPIRALSFAAGGGQVYHKYGPVPNLVLLPVYALTLGFWWLGGRFGPPSGDWPYGFDDPAGQIGVLIAEGRLVGLLLTATAAGALAREAARLGGDRAAALAAVLALVVGNVMVTFYAPSASVEAFSFAFLMLALAVLCRCVGDGVTVRRAVGFGVVAALAAGSKENVGPPLLLGAAGLAWHAARTLHAPQARRAVLWGLAAGPGTYTLTCVVYAPGVWLRRVRHWVGGDGLDAAVWAADDTAADVWLAKAAAVFDNLFVGGLLLAAAGVAAVLIWRRRVAAVLLLPAAGGLLPVLWIDFTPARFVTPAALCLVPAVAVGLSVLRRGNRVLWPWLVAPAVAVNLWWGASAIGLWGFENMAVIERHAATLPPGTTVAAAKAYPDNPQSRRLAALGLAADLRPVQAFGPGDGPAVVYLDAGLAEMFEQAKASPALRATFARDYGDGMGDWPGLAARGYARSAELRPGLPAWLPFGWAPLYGREAGLRTVQVWRLDGPRRAADDPPVTNPGGRR